MKLLSEELKGRDHVGIAAAMAQASGSVGQNRRTQMQSPHGREGMGTRGMLGR